MPCPIELRPPEGKTASLCAWAKQKDDLGNYISPSNADKYFRLEKKYRDLGYSISDGMCPYHAKIENAKLDKLVEKPRISPETIARIKALAGQGLSSYKVAAEVKLPQSTVYRIIHKPEYRAGQPGGARPHKTSLKSPDVAFIRKLHKSGKTVAEISEIVNLSEDRVRKLLKKKGRFTGFFLFLLALGALAFIF